MTTSETTTAATGSELIIRPEQAAFNDAQLAALHGRGMPEDASDADRAVFFHLCQRTQLDPFANQIQLIASEGEKYETVNGRRKSRPVTTYNTVTRIDGYRILGHRIAAERGDRLETGDAQWCGADGVWHDVWVDAAVPPAAAKYTITKDGAPSTAVVMYSEYVQLKPGSQTPKREWRKMPAGQLAKCAEAAAWRKTYPQDFAGLHVIDAMQSTLDTDTDTADTTDGEQTERVAPDVAAIMSARTDTPPAPKPAAPRKPRRPRRGAVDKATDAAADSAVAGGTE